MNQITRRTFLKTGAAAAAALKLGERALMADPLGLPVGLQLYSVRKLLPNDYLGTLKQVAAIGYREVEAAGFYNHSAEEVKAAMSTAGLHCVSAHYPMGELQKDVDGILKYAKAVGLSYVICSSPSVADPSKLASYPGGAGKYFRDGMTADDWRWNCDQFNEIGKKYKAEGIQFGYHNHTTEFHDLGGGLNGFEVLLKDTNPAYVTLEMDCGWVSAAGKDPIAFLKKYPGRFSMLHIKDLKPVTPGSQPSERHSTVLGKGTVDYKPIFAAAKTAGVKHYFVEQEEFDGDALDELKQDYQYLHAMRV
ncbi:sugar phosphate isomerase/epimerase [Acidobacterium sp. S8]|uniref:sugar phosphate isomerase/epimerase family protein n=1 Tax=Acidobacterium sp. S8 TaxID=1641854 RepID=UPI001C20573D|nr:sugar phosphate isomerase/epimerase [Acidobacterium sp. S8]